MFSLKKTIKMSAYSADAPKEIAPAKAAEDKKSSEELAKKTAQFEEEKNKSREHLNAIEQLRESLRQEQAKSAELGKRVGELEEKQNKLLESSKKLMDRQETKIAEQQRTLAEQQTTITDQQTKITALGTQLAGLQSRINEQETKSIGQTTRIKMLVEALEKVSNLATAVTQEKIG